VGRHGGRSGDNRDLDLGIDDSTRTFAGARAPARSGEEVTLQAPLGGRRWWDEADPIGAAPAGHTWWDDAPVPPPVVVASADDRTPAMTFSADADPFSVGGLFAPPAARTGEPAVVLHAAPDAAVSRGARRARSTARAAADATDTRRDVVTLLRERDGGPDTGSLVRPYVALTDPADPADPIDPADPASPAEPAELVLPTETVPGEEVTEPRPARRTRRAAGPLDRIIEVGPAAPVVPRPVGEWQAPWASEPAPSEEGPSRSLFEPVTPPPTFRNAWAAPAASSLPSRKAVRARERASATGTGSALEPAAAPGREARLTGRRLAKGGVLAVTAVGVVAASAPNAFSTLGWHLPAYPSGTQAALVSLAGSGTLPSRDVTLGSPAGSALLGATGSLSSPQGDNAAAARKDAAAVARAGAEAAARAGTVASGAGQTLVDVAREQVVAEAERKAKIAQQVSRNVIRDPRAYARLLLADRGWSSQFSCLNLLWNRESGWNYQAYNPSSGAYGIPQALPGSKMATIASDWRTNPATQITWGLNYIADRYGTPCGAWGHSEATGWY